ncbi:heparinase II/III-like protein [Arthrobacter sp. SLBN-100]|uniref:heparinase II/III family protein n=1 Tax=Arthrobacter sp. SLBN-100 TaxID=2768450 RepID=UPI001152AEF7|nr:heparinase II/III family protein [Arthrobacter sp. SLBN-100]TQJ68311.1 heparinase II/III-like protein [Arthrobacter sp. SLBN-100]
MAHNTVPTATCEAPLASAWGSNASGPELAELLAGARGRLRVRPAGNGAWEKLPAAALAALGRQAREEKGTEWPQPLVSHYARYFRDGNRTAYEGLVAARQQRITRAVVMALLPDSAAESGTEGAGGQDWLDEVIDGAYLLCEQSSWSWAAHDDVFSRSGEVVPRKSRPYLDLGAGEVAAQLAWLDHVLGEQLDNRAPGLRRRIREETDERVIQPFLERLDWHWLGLDGNVHNWNPWIHSNLLAAAIFLVDDPNEQVRTVARCIEGLDRFLASLPADGAIDEGFAYWWNGAGRMLEGLALLEEATGGALDADLPVIRELVAFPHRMHLGNTWFLNVADGPAQAAKALPWDMLQGWAARLGDKDAVRHAAAMVSPQPEPASGLGRVLHSLLTAADTSTAPQPPLVPFTYLPSVQIMAAREQAGNTEGLFLAAKGGHNGEHHNHRDVGSVVLAVDGVPLLVDAGQPTYTAKTFGPDRYQIRAMQSDWHSVPAPFGLEQGTGAEFDAEVLRAPEPGDPTIQLALGAAYGLRPDQWVRTASLDRKARKVEVADRWDLGVPPESGTSDVDITYLAAGTVTVGHGTVMVLPAGIPAAGTTRGAILRWEPAAAVVLVDEWLLDDPLLADIWGAKLTRLRFRLPAGLPENPSAAGAFTLTVEASA